jgi:hypothetical protein
MAHIVNKMNARELELFNRLNEEVKQMYLRISGEWLDDVRYYTSSVDNFIRLAGLVIRRHSESRAITTLYDDLTFERLERAERGLDFKQFARDLYTSFSPIKKLKKKKKESLLFLNDINTKNISKKFLDPLFPRLIYNKNIQRLMEKKPITDITIKNLEKISFNSRNIEHYSRMFLYIFNVIIKMYKVKSIDERILEKRNMKKHLLKINKKLDQFESFNDIDIEYEIENIRQNLKKIFYPENEKLKQELRQKLIEQAKEEKSRAKAAAKREIEKQKNRTRNTFCKNTIEFITQEDIEDIPIEDLTFIKLEKSIFCLDKDSFKNMIKFAKGQKVRGACKPAVEGKPLKCRWYYPINIGQNVYITEKNYNKIFKNDIEKRKFTLNDKRFVDFTTGLHMMSEKSGKDIVYNLVPDNYDIKEVKKQMNGGAKYTRAKKGKKQKKGKKVKSMTVKQLKAECKKRGIKRYSKLKKAELEKCLKQNGRRKN